MACDNFGMVLGWLGMVLGCRSRTAKVAHHESGPQACTVSFGMILGWFGMVMG